MLNFALLSGHIYTLFNVLDKRAFFSDGWGLDGDFCGHITFISSESILEGNFLLKGYIIFQLLTN